MCSLIFQSRGAYAAFFYLMQQSFSESFLGEIRWLLPTPQKWADKNPYMVVGCVDFLGWILPCVYHRCNIFSLG